MSEEELPEMELDEEDMVETDPSLDLTAATLDRFLSISNVDAAHDQGVFSDPNIVPDNNVTTRDGMSLYIPEQIWKNGIKRKQCPKLQVVVEAAVHYNISGDGAKLSDNHVAQFEAERNGAVRVTPPPHGNAHGYSAFSSVGISSWNWMPCSARSFFSSLK